MMSMGNKRLFIASPLSGPALTELAAFETRRSCITAVMPYPIKWVPSENWHLTWVFLGNTPNEAIENMCRQLSGLLHGLEPLTLDLNQCAFWPSWKKPQLLVWHTQAIRGPVFDLARELEVAFLPGKRSRQRWIPHITLARLKPQKDPIALHAKPVSQAAVQHIFPNPQSWHIQSIQVYESFLKPAGAEYQSLYTCPL